MTDQFPPFCGSEYYGPDGIVRTGNPMEWCALPRDAKKELLAICERDPHPVTELHADFGRGISWQEPGHYLHRPFVPPPGS